MVGINHITDLTDITDLQTKGFTFKMYLSDLLQGYPAAVEASGRSSVISPTRLRRNGANGSSGNESPQGRVQGHTPGALLRSTSAGQYDAGVRGAELELGVRPSPGG